MVSSSCILVCIPFQWNFRAARNLQTMTDSRAQGDQVDVVGTKNGRISLFFIDDLGDDLWHLMLPPPRSLWL